MGFHTGVVEPLRDFGLDVGFVPGWETRGSSAFFPAGQVNHHDAIATRWTSPPAILIDGRSDLPGPLCNTALQSTGKVWLVAAGRANHAGEGHWLNLDDNADVWGTEAQNAGTGQVWPDEQIDAYQRLNAAVCAYLEVDASTICRHAEWTTRKIDPFGPWESGGRWEHDMPAYRARVAELLETGGAPIDNLQEDDMIIRLKGQPSVLLAGPVAMLVAGPLVDTYEKGGVTVIDLPNTDPGRAQYRQLRRHATPWWKRVLRTRAA